MRIKLILTMMIMMIILIPLAFATVFTLLTPENNSLQTSWAVEYSFEIDDEGVYSLQVDTGTGYNIVDTFDLEELGSASSIQYYFNNYTVYWFVNDTEDESEIWTFNTSYTTQPAEAIDELDSLTIPKILLLIFLLLFGFGFLFLCLYSNIRELVVLSALVQFIVAIGMFVILPSSYLLGYLVGSIFIGLGFLCFAKFLADSDLLR